MATCFVCGTSGLLLFRCSNQSCRKVFCSDCGEGFGKANCPSCGNRRGESAGWLADLGDMAREANEQRAAEQAAAASAAAAAEQRRMRESQERMEREARAANEERLELERKRLELEEARQAEDKRQRDEAAHFRRLTSSVIEFTDRIIAALDRQPSAGAPQGSGRIGPETLAFSGGACEILSQMLSHRALGDAASSNPYFTNEDLQQHKHLQSRVGHLREKAACANFVLEARKLLARETSRCTTGTDQVDALLTQCRKADEACTEAITGTIEALRVEWYLLLNFHRRSEAHGNVLKQVQDFCSTQRGRIATATRETNLAAIDSFQPNAARVQAALGTLRSAIEAYGRQGQELVDQGRRLVHATEARLAEGRCVMPKSAATTGDAIDIGTLGVAGGHNEFLKFRRPPALTNLACSPALLLFLNIAEDVASGEIVVDQAQAIGGAHAEFMKAVTGIDKALSTARALPQTVKGRVASAASIGQSVLNTMSAERVERVTAEMRRTIAHATVELQRSEELARMGDIAFGERLRDRVTRKTGAILDTRTVDAVIEDQRKRLEAVEAAFASVTVVAGRRATGLRGFMNELVSDNSAGELRASLEAFFRHMTATRWGPGTELADGFCQRVQQMRDFCAEMEYRPSLRAWVILHDAVGRARPREISPTGAFVNALCAMAAAHDAIDGKETAAIHEALKARRVAIEESHVDEIIGEWNTVVAEKRLLSAVAQAVVDVAAITDARMLNMLNEDLKKVARADDNINDTEIAVYQAFLTAIMRQMYADLLPT